MCCCMEPSRAQCCTSRAGTGRVHTDRSERGGPNDSCSAVGSHFGRLWWELHPWKWITGVLPHWVLECSPTERCTSACTTLGAHRLCMHCVCICALCAEDNAVSTVFCSKMCVSQYVHAARCALQLFCVHARCLHTACLHTWAV